MVGVVSVCGYKLYADSDTKMRIRSWSPSWLLCVALFLVAASDHGTVGDTTLQNHSNFLEPSADGDLGLVGPRASKTLSEVFSSETIATLNSSNILDSTTANFFADLDGQFLNPIIPPLDCSGFRIFPDAGLLLQQARPGRIPHKQRCCPFPCWKPAVIAGKEEDSNNMGL